MEYSIYNILNEYVSNYEKNIIITFENLDNIDFYFDLKKYLVNDEVSISQIEEFKDNIDFVTVEEFVDILKDYSYNNQNEKMAKESMVKQDKEKEIEDDFER